MAKTPHFSPTVSYPRRTDEQQEMKTMTQQTEQAALDGSVEPDHTDDDQLSTHEALDRELRRQILSDKDAMAAFYRADWECDGCATKSCSGDFFVDFHGLLLCDGCTDAARDRLRELQRPLIEALVAEPTMKRALALGFELTRRGDDNRLVWIGDDDSYDGGNHPYANEHDALEDLVDELG